MLAMVPGHRVVERDDGMATSGVPLIDEWHSGTKRQSTADAQRYAVESVVVAVFGTSIRVTAVLCTVSQFVEDVRSESRLQRRRPDEITKPKRICPLNLIH